MSQSQVIPCALCQQPVEVQLFYLHTTEGIKHFCCEGCKHIYQLVNPPAHIIQPAHSRNPQ